MAEVGFLSPGSFLGENCGKPWILNFSCRGLDLSNLKSEWEKRRFVDVVRSLGTVVLYVVAWFARILLVFLPQRTTLDGLSSALESFSQEVSIPSVPQESEFDQHVNVLASGAIGRALLQVLALVNDLPASSRKYAFARSLAEKIIQENAAHGHGYESVNRAAMCAGFKRTLAMLNLTLQGIHYQQRATGDLWSLPKKILRMLPIPTSGLKCTLPPIISLLLSQIGFLLPSFSTVPSSPIATEIFPTVGTSNVGDEGMAEKLAQELLWMSEKLAEISALDEGIVQWSSSASLASISLVASPRVQRALVRLSALFAEELVSGNVEVPRDVKFKMLLLWLPLFCSATHGGDGPIFTASERMEAENALDKVISALPESDQEVILAVWLQEFSLSSSDWPNLQSCYNGWCNTTRKLSDQTYSGCSQG